MLYDFSITFLVQQISLAQLHFSLCCNKIHKHRAGQKKRTTSPHWTDLYFSHREFWSKKPAQEFLF